MNECPKCGSDEGVYVHERYSGTWEFRMGFNGENGDNNDMYGGIKEERGKYVYCINCRKRLMTLKEFEDSL